MRARILHVLSGPVLFFTGCGCGVITFIGDIDWLIAVGGGLLLGAGMVVLLRRDDPLNRLLDAIPTGFATSYMPKGWVRRIFLSFTLGAIGAAWLVTGLAPRTP